MVVTSLRPVIMTRLTAEQLKKSVVIAEPFEFREITAVREAYSGFVFRHRAFNAAGFFISDTYVHHDAVSAVELPTGLDMPTSDSTTTNAATREAAIAALVPLIAGALADSAHPERARFYQSTIIATRHTMFSSIREIVIQGAILKIKSTTGNGTGKVSYSLINVADITAISVPLYNGISLI